MTIDEKFINGTYKVYKKMFSQKVFYTPLVEAVVDPIYDEFAKVVYGIPIPLVAKVSLSLTFDSVPPKDQKFTSDFHFPFKSLRDNGVDVLDHANHKKIQQGYLTYKDINYTIMAIEPLTFIGDSFIVWSFKCVERK